MKRIYILALCAGFIFNSRSHAVELSGYFESQLMGADLSSRFYLLQSNKIRIDLYSELNSRITFAANVNAISYHGKTEWAVPDFISDELAAGIPDYLMPYYVIQFEDRAVLDNAYMRYSGKNVDLMVGKQQISPGIGYAWNPVDVFNNKDILDPTYEQPGHNAIRCDVTFNSRFSICALFGAGEQWTDSDKMISMKGGISRFDFSVIFTEKPRRMHEYLVLDPNTRFFTEIHEKRKMLGGFIDGELLGMGIWSEYAYNHMEQSESFYEWLIGLDYTFDFQTYIMVEYYRNTMGKTDVQKYTFNDWMRYFSLEQKAICRDQIYLFLQQPVTDFVQIGFSGIMSLSDKSFGLIPTLNWSLSDNVALLAYLNLYPGDEGTMYSRDLGNGMLIRMTAYF